MSSSSPTFPRFLFVYGTLMRGYCNHHLLANATFVSCATTVKAFAMYSAEYPFVTQAQATTHIHGEVYEITSAADWTRLDELEGHPDEYERLPCEVSLSATGRVVSAQLYFNERWPTEGEGVEFVESGNYSDAAMAAQRRNG